MDMSSYMLNSTNERLGAIETERNTTLLHLHGKLKGIDEQLNQIKASARSGKRVLPQQRSDGVNLMTRRKHVQAQIQDVERRLGGLEHKKLLISTIHSNQQEVELEKFITNNYRRSGINLQEVESAMEQGEEVRDDITEVNNVMDQFNPVDLSTTDEIGDAFDEFMGDTDADSDQVTVSDNHTVYNDTTSWATAPHKPLSALDAAMGRKEITYTLDDEKLEEDFDRTATERVYGP
jgi:hypothetical protein